MKTWFEFFYGKLSPLNPAGKFVLTPVAIICFPVWLVLELLFKKEWRG